MKAQIMMLPLLLAIAGCSKSRDVMEELPNSSIAGSAREAMTETQIESTLARPVTIGEDGPRLDACGAMGIVRGLETGRMLDVRTAPFEAAKVMEKLGDGARVHICTRSIDQRWLGVVIVPASPPPLEGAAGNSVAAESPDCGVSSPVDGKRAYDGPCKSGWVSSGFIQSIAG